MTGSGLAVVVLAGGEGRRMAGGKPERVLAGRSLLARALDAAKLYGPEVAVSLRAGDQTSVPEGATILIDDPAIPGPLAGIAAALAYARASGAASVLTIPCDAPFLPGDLAERLQSIHSPNAGVAMAASGGRLHPVCALWRAGLGPMLAAYAATGRGSLMGLAEAVGWAAVDWPAEPVDPFFNINTPADLAEAEAILA